MKERVFLGLGSNLGDRAANVLNAVEKLSQSFGCAPLAMSELIETRSWGFDAPSFINAVVVYELEIDPFKLLSLCKEIETLMGREQKVEYDSEGKRVYHSRVIDIDILMMGDRRMDAPLLKIPHPLMEARDFVMIPLRDVMDKLNN